MYPLIDLLLTEEPALTAVLAALAVTVGVIVLTLPGGRDGED